MKIPYYGIKRFYEENSDEILQKLHSVYSSGMMFGKDIEEFESELCRLTGRKYAIAVNSCTDALYFALLCGGIEKGDEVLVTSFSFIASAGAILRAGAVPVFVDIKTDTCLMDLEDLKRKISTNSRAIIGVHLFGLALGIPELEDIARSNRLFLIEDAAQALGSFVEDRPAGSMGNVSCLSFDPTKVISAFGSGGALLTDDSKIYSTALKLRYHGKGENNEFEMQGINSRLSAPQCSLLTYQIREHLQRRILRMQEISSFYGRELKDIPELLLPEVPNEHFHIFHKYVMQTNRRDDLRKYLKTHGIETMIHYQRALFENIVFQNYKFKAENISVCPGVCNRVISLPIYPELTDQEIEYICSTIQTFFRDLKNV